MQILLCRDGVLVFQLDVIGEHKVDVVCVAICALDNEMLYRTGSCQKRGADLAQR